MVNFSIFDSATSELFHAISILVELRLYYGKFAFFSLNFGCTMVNLKRFSKWVMEMGCTMGKMARHVSKIGCTMGKTIKNVFFRAFFEGQKNKKRVPRS